MPDDLVPWLDDDSEEAMPKHLLALHVAATQVGVRELSRNSGPMVDRFLAAVGLRPGFAWCASFVYWSLRRAGIPTSALPKRWKAAAVRFWHDWAVANNRRMTTPERGCLFYWLKRANGPGHIGWVRSVEIETDVVGTIEGNTNFAGSREGDGVYRKRRTIHGLESNAVWGFISLEGLAK